MKTKLLWAASAVLGISLAIGYAQGPTRNTESRVGRFQLVTTNPGARVYRIDTATGNTWMELTISQSGAEKSLWVPIPEPSK
jgi:hypothetical protein